MATEVEFGGVSFEETRPPFQELLVRGITIEEYNPVPPPRVALRGLTFESHRFKPKRKRLFRKQWW